MTSTPTPAARAPEEFGEQLFGAVLGTQLVQSVYVGATLASTVRWPTTPCSRPAS